MRFHFDSEKDYPFLNIFLVEGISSQNSSGFSSQNSSQNCAIELFPRLNVAETAEVLSAVFSGLYGSCLMPDDEQLVLQLLHDLMRLQLTSAANPRDNFGLEGSLR